ncbi:MAG: hypothetical protein ACI9K1_001059 [Arcticibacterium sp.]|jgi:hypothetical protein
MVSHDLNSMVGESLRGVLLETCTDLNKSISRPRVRPKDTFPADMRVEFPRKLRELFPIGTEYRATVKVCQKHNADGSEKGEPYLRASDIALIPKSIKDEGLVAKVQAGSISGLAYEYIHEKTF